MRSTFHGPRLPRNPTSARVASQLNNFFRDARHGTEDPRRRKCQPPEVGVNSLDGRKPPQSSASKRNVFAGDQRARLIVTKSRPIYSR